MKIAKTLFALLLSIVSYSQNKTFEIFGTISGHNEGKIYLFYDGNYKQKDSIYADIKDGKFYIKATAVLPILARLHFGQQSFIQDIYIDGKKSYLKCTNEIEVYGKDRDTMNRFTITSVNGSRVESLKRNFENRLTELKGSTKPEEEKNQEYFNELYAFVKKYPKSKVSLYLIGKASTLRYSQVSELIALTDTALKNTFEWKGVTRLLNSLDKSKNKAIGKVFHDVVLKDTSDFDVSTRDLRGRYVFIDFWASWCKPCRAANPALKVLYEKYKGKAFEIVGVSFDKEKDKWRQAIITDGLPWIQIIDEKGFNGDLGRYYDVESIPANILLDKEGRIIGVGLSTTEVEEIIGKFL